MQSLYTDHWQHFHGTAMKVCAFLIVRLGILKVLLFASVFPHDDTSHHYVQKHVRC